MIEDMGSFASMQTRARLEQATEKEGLCFDRLCFILKSSARFEAERTVTAFWVAVSFSMNQISDG